MIFYNLSPLLVSKSVTRKILFDATEINNELQTKRVSKSY